MKLCAGWAASWWGAQENDVNPQAALRVAAATCSASLCPQASPLPVWPVMIPQHALPPPPQHCDHSFTPHVTLVHHSQTHTEVCTAWETKLVKPPPHWISNKKKAKLNPPTEERGVLRNPWEEKWKEGGIRASVTVGGPKGKRGGQQRLVLTPCVCLPLLACRYNQGHWYQMEA